MSKKEIKYVSKLSVPHIRKRDGELVTHCLRIALSDDEALALSELLSAKKETDPHLSLIRAFLINQALKEIDEQRLIEIMADFKTKRNLAVNLSRLAYDRAMSYIKNPPPIAPAKPIPEAIKPERRIYTPEPRRR